MSDPRNVGEAFRPPAGDLKVAPTSHVPFEAFYRPMSNYFVHDHQTLAQNRRRGLKPPTYMTVAARHVLLQGGGFSARGGAAFGRNPRDGSNSGLLLVGRPN